MTPRICFQSSVVIRTSWLRTPTGARVSMRSSPTSDRPATAFSGIAHASAMMKASKSCVSPDPLRAQGTVIARVLPRSRQATCGTAAWMKGLCSKNRRCSQLRHRVSWAGGPAAAMVKG